MMATRPTDTDDQKPGAEGEPTPQTHDAAAKLSGEGTFSANAKVLRKVYIFRCSNKAGLFAVSPNFHGDNLPPNICTGGWVRHGEALVEPGISHLTGFVSADLYRDLEKQGFHIASGVRTSVSQYQSTLTTAVSGAISTANTRTRFFKTDSDA
jgi:hypothetical protein